MKVKIILALFLLSTLPSLAQEGSCAEEILSLWNEYNTQCYADSALEFLMKDGWVRAEVWRGWKQVDAVIDNIQNYRWAHKEPSLQDFIRFLENKAHLSRTRARYEELKKISERIADKLR